MKISLVTFDRNSLGVRQISSYLKQKGFSVDLMVVDPARAGEIDLARFGEADLVGIGVITDRFRCAGILAGRIRERFGAGKPAIIFGGPHATIMPRSCLEFCDYAVKGEAEETMLHICSRFPEIGAINGVCRLIDGKLIENPPAPLIQDLDKYPVLDFTGYGAPDNYNILASRGCPYSCSYCYNNYLKKLYHGGGPYLRKRGVDGILIELKAAVTAFPGLKRISFYDDTLLARSARELAELFGRYRAEIGLPFFCLASPGQLTDEKLGILAQAGLERIQIGMQTGSEPVNYKIYKRPVPNSKITECAELCLARGVEVYFDVIFNNPYETAGDVGRTLDFLLALPLPRGKIHLQGFNLIFYPGTEITESAVRDGYISEKRGSAPDRLTIQGISNTPLFFDSSLDNPLWNIHFSSEEKEHFNTLIALTPYFPKFLVRFLKGRPGTVCVIRLVLKTFIRIIVKYLLRQDNIVMSFFRRLR
ncbi:MAG: cobalamin B12-binding domain-containing protein [Elusimicrobia bacterium]|nr:cobalamin B12-binding domain-containing protein [Elusimicrobiota bacterium]